MSEDNCKKKPIFKSKEALQTLRRCFDLEDEKEVEACYMKYTKTVEIFRAYGQTRDEPLDKKHIIDWCLPAAICPEWYADSLADRLNSTMLVSALLITVTAVNIFDPPDGFESSNQHEVRAFVFINAITTLIFLLSIFFGTAFIENAMSRTYGKIERLLLIKRFYIYKDFCQLLMGIGVGAFPFACTSGSFAIMEKLDAWILIILSALFALAATRVLISLISAANGWMIHRVNWIYDICDDQGHILEDYRPIDPEMTPEDFKQIYGGDFQSSTMASVFYTAAKLFNNVKGRVANEDSNLDMSAYSIESNHIGVQCRAWMMFVFE